MGISLASLISNPDNPIGGIMRKIFGINLEKNDLENAHNPFAKIEFDETLEKSTLTFTEGLNSAEILEDPKGGKILEALQQFKVCEGLEVKEFNVGKNEMQLRASNWKQVAFLRKFLPRESLGEEVKGLADKFTQNKGVGNLQEYLKGIIPDNKAEYKTEQKKDFPDMVSVTSSGFNVTVKWQDARLAWNAFLQAEDLKNKSN